MPSLTPLKSITKINSLVTRILGFNPGFMTLQGTNTYIVGNGAKRILIDTGEANKPKYIEALRNHLTSENIGVDQIIITHWHHDHIGGLENVVSSITDGLECKVWKFPRSDETEPNTIGSSTINYLVDGQELTTAGATLKVVHTPGHSTDHIGLLLMEKNELFSGDSVLGEGTAVFDDLSDYMNSLRIFLRLNPTTIYPSHGPVIENPKEKIEEYIYHRNQRESQILGFLESLTGSSITSNEIVKTLYADVPEQLHLAAERNVVLHLGKLLKEKKVVQEKDNWKYNPIPESNL